MTLTSWDRHEDGNYQSVVNFTSYTYVVTQVHFLRSLQVLPGFRWQLGPPRVPLRRCMVTYTDISFPSATPHMHTCTHTGTHANSPQTHGRMCTYTQTVHTHTYFMVPSYGFNVARSISISLDSLGSILRPSLDELTRR